MNHFIAETLPLFGFGLAGILIMLFTKINDLNHKLENEALSFNQTMTKFFRREWASYCVSLLIVGAASCSHDEWLPLLTSGKASAIIDVTLGVKMGMLFFGMMGHYFLYKFFLGKLDK